MNRRPLLQTAAVLVAPSVAISIAVAAACSPSAKPESAHLAAQSVDAPAAAKPIDPAARATPAGASLIVAKPVSLGAAGATEIGQIDSAANFYRIDNGFKVRDVVIVRLENLSSTLAPNLIIYNGERSLLGEKYDRTPGASVEHVLTLVPGQPIYVEVRTAPVTSSGGKYALRVQPQQAFDTLEPNDDVLSASPATVGRDVVANIMDDEDQDWLHFSGASQKPLTVTLENQSATLSPYVQIYNANKSALVEHYDRTPGADLSFILPSEAGVDFYVRVLTAPATNSTGRYKLSVK